MTILFYQLDTGWACGGIFVREGRVTGGAPIFRRLIGQKLATFPSRYHLTRIDA